MKLDKILLLDNVASHLSKEKLEEIGVTVVEHYEADVASRMEWEDRYERWQDMTGQVMEMKSKPWRGAANIKYPLLTQAALQFNARVVPALMPNAEPVGAGVIGPDEGGERTQVAQAVAKHMNYQLTSEMEEWEEQFDSLLIAISISGTEFKKTYYDPYKQRNVSKHLSPRDLVINYYAEDKIDDVRKTEIHRWNKRFLLEQINAGIFLEIDWDKQPDPALGKQTPLHDRAKERLGMMEPTKQDSATPYTVLEYHGWYDLDEDGYEEPYIITVMEDTRQVLQVIPRFVEQGIQYGAGDRVVKIDAYESYTKYVFIPDPDGSFYGIGFGHILYPINATVNTAINQLLDSGTLNNMPAGFISRGVQMKGGMFSMTPGKWFSVNSTGDDLRKGMMPLPVGEPSNVLMSLLVYMVQAAEKLSATTDIFTGEHPGQNTKASVTAAVREEGQKVFTAIYKRIRRSLKKELDKLYALNAQILASPDGQETIVARGAQIFGISPEFYTGEMNIQPSADPNIAVKEQKVQKDMTVLELTLQTGVGNKVEALRRLYRTLEVEGLDRILPEDAQEPPNPEAMAAQQEAQLEQAKLQLEAAKYEADMRIREAELQLKKAIAEADAKIEILKLGNEMDKAGMEAAGKIEDNFTKVVVAKEAARGRDNQNSK